MSANLPRPGEVRDSKEVFLRCHFPLHQDEDGYPPYGVETLWCRAGAEGVVRVDSVPFFTDDVSSDDDVRTRPDADGHAWFDGVTQHNGHSVVRISLDEQADDRRLALAEEMKRLGCATEWSSRYLLLVVDVPPWVDGQALRDWLQRGEDKGEWEWFDGHVCPE